MHEQMKKHWVLGAVMVMGFGLAVFAATIAAGETLARSGRPGDGGITVSSEAIVKVAPDRAQVTLGLESQGATAGEAQDKNAEKMENVIERLVAAGIKREDIKTRSYNLNPLRRWDDKAGTEVSLGFQAINLVSVTTGDVENLGRLIDTATSAGANNVQDVTFDVSEKSRAREAAMDQAVGKARSKAARLAEAAGVRLGAATRVSEVTADAPVIPVAYAQMKAADSRAEKTTPIEPGQVTITAHVDMTFAIR